MTKPPTRVVLDFDGTCTLVEQAAEGYLEAYRQGFSTQVSPLTAEEWGAALARVRGQSPQAGWTLAGTPSAPVAADPYILAYETASHLMRERRLPGALPYSLHGGAYAASPAPWRPDVREVLETLDAKGVSVFFVSNSDSAYIEGRLDGLFPNGGSVRQGIVVRSGAGKFRVCELPWEDQPFLNEGCRDIFRRLPSSLSVAELGRPVYVRRGSYFEALSRALEGDCDGLGDTLFCGDIWELDLAMPRLLGARIHLIERAAPFETYDYERRAIAAEGVWANSGRDLASLLQWF
jgi:hypothetical protein